MPEQLGQIIEGIDTAKPAGMDQAHVDIADVGTLCGLVEQRVLTMKDRQFQGSLANVKGAA